jgi:hypothetical protein
MTQESHPDSGCYEKTIPYVLTEKALSHLADYRSALQWLSTVMQSKQYSRTEQFYAMICHGFLSGSTSRLTDGPLRWIRSLERSHIQHARIAARVVLGRLGDER